ncbi:DUF4386 domain-containing protein [Salsipaludibacter albus]|uniref:DUF4386 domain-containing protein n=1 Tax=Salsipaludibacter albus TaxID=2849650 RepID=UPI001EE4B417|nr:DUF4386 domain-containing protein [Salsipaludibacter albus]MBY5162147.1 DUF4386 domain-containing protein [Salsipaludibacter albus]
MTTSTLPTARTVRRTDDVDGGPATTSRRRAAVIAGVGYVLLFALAIFANFAVFETMVVPGDPATTVANIAADPLLFRLAVVAFLAVFVIDVVVAWALHLVFRPVDADRSLLTAWSRLTYTVFLGVALVFAMQALALAEGGAAVAALDDGARAAQAMLALQAFDVTWLVGLVAFGLHLVLLGTLVLRAGETSRLLGWLLVVAGVAYAVDTVAHLVLADYEAVAGVMLAIVFVPSVLAEGWMGLWLLLRAGRGTPPTADLEPVIA